VQSLPANHF